MLHGAVPTATQLHRFSRMHRGAIAAASYNISRSASLRISSVSGSLCVLVNACQKLAKGLQSSPTRELTAFRCANTSFREHTGLSLAPSGTIAYLNLRFL
jgi:hypothetical protein